MPNQGASSRPWPRANVPFTYSWHWGCLGITWDMQYRKYYATLTLASHISRFHTQIQTCSKQIKIIHNEVLKTGRSTWQGSYLSVQDWNVPYSPGAVADHYFARKPDAGISFPLSIWIFSKNSPFFCIQLGAASGGASSSMQYPVS